jgi:O-antigen/teichoic acid export membrane protein
MKLSLSLFNKSTLSILLTLILAYLLIDQSNMQKLTIIILPVIAIIAHIIFFLKIIQDRTLVYITFVLFIFQFFLVRFLFMNLYVVNLTMFAFIFYLVTMFFTQFNFLNQE